jgi:LysM repeat protein
VTTSPGVRTRTISARSAQATPRNLPPYWTVRPGDTLTEISAKTGLSIQQLDAYNPNTDPQSLVPGQRLLLWPHPPAPRPKPLGPRFWTVRPGDSFGAIAAKTGINLAKLEQLNPQLKPATLQPGDRVRLRP